MYVDLYLPSITWKMISHFGDRNIVINEILKLASKGMFDISDKPPAPSKNETKYSHKLVTIEDTYFLELTEVFSPHSSKISLRRLIFWFFDNDMTYLFYENGELNSTLAKLKSKKSRKMTHLDKIKEILDKMHKNLNKLHNEIANEKEKCYYSRIKDELDNFTNNILK